VPAAEPCQTASNPPDAARCVHQTSDAARHPAAPDETSEPPPAAPSPPPTSPSSTCAKNQPDVRDWEKSATRCPPPHSAEQTPSPAGQPALATTAAQAAGESSLSQIREQAPPFPETATPQRSAVPSSNSQCTYPSAESPPVPCAHPAKAAGAPASRSSLLR